MESLTTNITVADLCSKYNVNPNQYYIWKERFLDGSKLALSSPKDTANDKLSSENERLKRLIGELTVANDAFKKRWKQEGEASCGKRDERQGTEPEKSPRLCRLQQQSVLSQTRTARHSNGPADTGKDRGSVPLKIGPLDKLYFSAHHII
jgi:hypothetical protein